MGASSSQRLEDQCWAPKKPLASTKRLIMFSLSVEGRARCWGVAMRFSGERECVGKPILKAPAPIAFAGLEAFCAERSSGLWKWERGGLWGETKGWPGIPAGPGMSSFPPTYPLFQQH